MKSIGSVVASLAYGKIINPMAIEVAHDLGCFTQSFVDGCGLCESPIEQIILARLCNTKPIGFEQKAVIHNLQSGEEFPNRPLVIVPQFPIARFRLDFFVVVVVDRRAWQFAIECDGQEFHTKLPQRQADYDRDTYLARIGIRTFRYWGQNIYSGEARPDRDIIEHIFTRRRHE